MREGLPCSSLMEQFLSTEQEDVRRSLAICNTCPVLDVCKAETLEVERMLGHTIHGTIGATTEQQRVLIHAAA